VSGLAVLAIALVYPRASRSNFEFGLLYTVTRYDQALPLVGIGIAIAQLPRRLCLVSLIILAAGIPAGGLMSDWVLGALSEHSEFVGYLFLIAPVCCAIVGLALVMPNRIAVVLTPLAAFLSGAALGLVVSFDDPSAAAKSFAAGAVLSGLWLTVPPLLLWRRFNRPWFPIAGRIFGAWLIAIGAMLTALELISRPPPPEPRVDASASEKLGAGPGRVDVPVTGSPM